MKTKERERARELRRAGCSVKEIQRLVGVSQSSVSLWVRDIELTAEQHQALRWRNPAHNPERNGARVQSMRARARRRAHQWEGRVVARSRHSLHATGCMLYWAEGSKDRNVVKLTNSDPEVVCFFLSFLRACFGVPDTKVRVTCNLFADHLERQRQIERYWLDLLELPDECLTKSAVNVYSKYSQKKRANKLPYGTCRLSVADTRIVQHIYGAIQAYAGFERPEWLD